MGRLLDKFEVSNRMAQRIHEWETMPRGASYACGYDDQGMFDDWVSRAAMEDMKLEWERRTGGSKTYSTVWSIFVYGATEFVLTDAGHRFNFRLRAE